jgi:co-chaperonin GroES (HSP10)
MPQRAMVHDVDPRFAIWEAVGDLDKIEIPYSRVLVGIYERPEKTKSGIILTHHNRDEDQWQGKVCMVLKKGPLAYKDTSDISHHGFSVKKGDWVVIRASDGLQMNVNGKACRLIFDADVKMVVNDPDSVW